MRVLHAAAFCGLAMALLAGCGSTTGGSATSPAGGGTSTETTSSAVVSSSSTGVPVPMFDPCHDIPTDFLSTEGLVPGAAPTDETRGDLRWKGCQYQKANVYTTTITSTDMTVDQLMQRHRYQFRRSQISGRDTGTDGPEGLDGGDNCVVLVSTRGGGLNVEATNSFQLTTSTDPCQFATDLATKLVPLLPAGS